jgi:hypothetical protein
VNAVILDEIAAQRLPRRAEVRWGALRKGDVIICPHDGLPEGVLRVSTSWPGRAHVEMGFEDPEGVYPLHTHVRPASDVVATP